MLRRNSKSWSLDNVLVKVFKLNICSKKIQNHDLLDNVLVKVLRLNICSDESKFMILFAGAWKITFSETDIFWWMTKIMILFLIVYVKVILSTLRISLVKKISFSHTLLKKARCFKCEETYHHHFMISCFNSSWNCSTLHSIFLKRCFLAQIMTTFWHHHKHCY